MTKRTVDEHETQYWIPPGAIGAPIVVALALLLTGSLPSGGYESPWHESPEPPEHKLLRDLVGSARDARSRSERMPDQIVRISLTGAGALGAPVSWSPPIQPILFESRRTHMPGTRTWGSQAESRNDVSNRRFQSIARE